MAARPHVLIATASSNLGQLVDRELRRQGYGTHQEPDAAAACRALAGGDYGALVTDAHLAGCHGPSLVHDLRSRGIDTPAVLLIESETTCMREAARVLGGTRCLAGPDLSRLSLAIASACADQVV